VEFPVLSVPTAAPLASTMPIKLSTSWFAVWSEGPSVWANDNKATLCIGKYGYRITHITAGNSSSAGSLAIPESSSTLEYPGHGR